MALPLLLPARRSRVVPGDAGGNDANADADSDDVVVSDMELSIAGDCGTAGTSVDRAALRCERDTGVGAATGARSSTPAPSARSAAASAETETGRAGDSSAAGTSTASESCGADRRRLLRPWSASPPRGDTTTSVSVVVSVTASARATGSGFCTCADAGAAVVGAVLVDAAVNAGAEAAAGAGFCC